MEGTTVGDRIWVVVNRLDKESGQPIARPTENPDYAERTIFVEPDADIGDVVEIQVEQVSGEEVVGRIITKSDERIQRSRRGKLFIPKKYDFTERYERYAENVRKDLPDHQ